MKVNKGFPVLLFKIKLSKKCKVKVNNKKAK